MLAAFSQPDRGVNGILRVPLLFAVRSGRPFVRYAYTMTCHSHNVFSKLRGNGLAPMAADMCKLVRGCGRG